MKTRIKKQPARAAVPLRFGNKLTLEQFTKSDVLREDWRTLLRTPTGQAALEVLMTHLPYPGQFAYTAPNATAIELGRINGYRQCIEVMLAMAEQPKAEQPLTEDWSQPAGPQMENE